MNGPQVQHGKDHPPFETAHATDIGGRRYNQDAVARLATSRPAFAIIDGMGGEGTHPNAGGITAQWAANTLASTLDAPNLTDLITALSQAYRAAPLTPKGEEKGDATLAVLQFTPTATLVAWVGDCAVVRVRDATAKLLTRPHNVAGARFFPKGVWTPQAESDYRAARGRNHVLRGLQHPAHHERYPDSADYPSASHFTSARSGDVYVLLTDGAFDALGTECIGQLVTQHCQLDVDTAARRILDTAGDRTTDREPDNRTLILIRFI